MGKELFGTLPDGRDVYAYVLENKNGMKIKVIEYGAILVSVWVPDKKGVLRDVVLGYDTLQEYEKNGSFFGSTIGRSGNRIAGASFFIGDKKVQLTPNEGENNLHSGPEGFEKKLWDSCQKGNSVVFSRLSADGENGYPGDFQVSVTYTLTEEDEVQIDYQAVCDQDTVANMTNHSYFNLAGQDGGKILGQKVKLCAGCYIPVDECSIPTGEIADVAGTPMDFREEKEIGSEIESDFVQLRRTGGYDHTYVLDKPLGSYGKMAEAFCRESGIRMEAYTDCPGVQFYTGNFIEKECGKAGAAYEPRCGYCFESQYYPNAVNEPSFPSPVLKAGETYRSRTGYRFWTEGKQKEKV